MPSMQDIKHDLTSIAILWPPDAKNWLIRKDPDAGKDWSQEDKGTTDDEMVGWHHWLDGHEFELALGVGDEQGSLPCCSPWGLKESDMTEQMNWTTSMGDECNCPINIFFSTTLLGNWEEDWPFPVLWPLLVFQICWRIEYNTLMTSSFRVLNSSTEIPSHPLALLTAVLPKAYLTSLSRISGSRWLTTPLEQSSSFGPFLHSSSVSSSHLLLISSTSARSIPFMSFIVPIFGQKFPLIFPVFLKGSLVFPFYCFLLVLYTVDWRRLLVSWCCSLEIFI